METWSIHPRRGLFEVMLDQQRNLCIFSVEKLVKQDSVGVHESQFPDIEKKRVLILVLLEFV